VIELNIQPAFGARRGLVRLRVPLAEAAHAAAALELPTEPLHWSGSDPVALWMSPDQWLLVGERYSAERVLELCRARLGDLLYSATDASDALSCVRVAGSRARALLAMGSGVDFDPSVLTPGRCLRTRFAKVAVVLRVLPEDEFELFVDRSVAHYVEQWLQRAARDPVFED